MQEQHSLEGSSRRVEVADPERMHLLGLMLASVLSRRLEDARAAANARKIKKPVVIIAGEMVVSLHFEEGRVAVRREPPAERVGARIEGTLMALLDVALGQKRLRHVLLGRIRVRGSPLVLLRMLALLRS